MNVADFYRLAVGVPFVEHGRDFGGWDCWGLCLVAYQEVLGVALPDFTYETVKDVARLESQFGARSAYVRGCEPCVMDVAVIFRRNRAIHAGLVVPGRRILHVEIGIETCAEPFNNFRVEGFYRVV